MNQPVSQPFGRHTTMYDVLNITESDGKSAVRNDNGEDDDVIDDSNEYLNKYTWLSTRGARKFLNYLMSINILKYVIKL